MDVGPAAHAALQLSGHFGGWPHLETHDGVPLQVLMPIGENVTAHFAPRHCFGVVTAESQWPRTIQLGLKRLYEAGPAGTARAAPGA